MDTPENNSFVHDELPAMVEIIGISFRGATKIYYFAANGCVAKEGDNAIVETARGLEYGKVTLANREVKREELVLPLKNVIRIADKNDDLRYEANREKEKEAFDICMKKITDHALDMKLIDVEYTFDNSKLLFYFTSDDRVDFRELVKDLAGYFRTRIELRQIGIRDEAKIMGGLGICGRPFCCSTFLPDFVQVSIKMAKEQNLSLNSAKISGACGRLMCCLRYEYDTYQEELRRMPKMDSTVVTPDGVGVVTEIKPLENTVKVLLQNENEKAPKVYHLSVLKPYDKNAPIPEVKPQEEVAQAKKEAVEQTRAPRRDKRNAPGEEGKKKHEDQRGDKKPLPKAAEVKKSEDVREGSEEKTAPADKEASQNHHNRNNKNRRGKGNRPHGDSSSEGKPEVKMRFSSESKPKNESEESQNKSHTGRNDRGNRSRHQNKHGGDKVKDPASQSGQGAPSAEQQSKKNPSPDKNSPEKTQTPEGGSRKSYAPMPSNSIKKNNKRKF